MLELKSIYDIFMSFFEPLKVMISKWD